MQYYNNKLNSTVIFIKKKQYFCSEIIFHTNDTTHSNHLFDCFRTNFGSFIYVVSSGFGRRWIAHYWTKRTLGFWAYFPVCRVVDYFYFKFQKTAGTICAQPFKHHIKLCITGGFRLQIAHFIRRNVGFREGYWDISSYHFYRIFSAGQQGHKKGWGSRKICWSFTVNRSWYY